MKIILSLTIVLVVSCCSRVLENIELQLDSRDTTTQQDFVVVEKTLTISEAAQQNKSPYNRSVLLPGGEERAGSISEADARKSNFPKNNGFAAYRIGIGDTLAFSRLIHNYSKQIENKWLIKLKFLIISWELQTQLP